MDTNGKTGRSYNFIYLADVSAWTGDAPRNKISL